MGASPSEVHHTNKTQSEDTSRTAVSRLTLTQFRNHQSFAEVIDHQSVLITGRNGSGKTNILEALSLLSPGRGMRGARLEQLQHQPPQHMGWGVAVELLSRGQRVDIATGAQPMIPDKRVLRIDGQECKSQNQLLQHSAILWQTPQMDGLFAQGNTERRRYFDRLTTAMLPDHSSRLAKYEHFRRERMNILQQGGENDLWLSTIESKLAEMSMAIAEGRLSMLQSLNHALTQLPQSFPKAQISVLGDAETPMQMQTQTAIEDEQALREVFRQARQEDRMTGRAAHGAHKAIWQVVFSPKGVEATYCSTGEQKALMLSILLAQISAIKQQRSQLPIVLLDEAIAHLDAYRRDAFFEVIKHLQPQIWLTATESDGLAKYFKDELHIELA